VRLKSPPANRRYSNGLSIQLLEIFPPQTSSAANHMFSGTVEERPLQKHIKLRTGPAVPGLTGSTTFVRDGFWSNCNHV
jgi:hypothetical protein